MAGGSPYPPVNRMTNRCKNITLPQTSFAGGKNVTIEKIIRTCILLCGRLEYYYAAAKTPVTGTIFEMTPIHARLVLSDSPKSPILRFTEETKFAKNWAQRVILNKLVKHFNLSSPATLVGVLLSAQITILLFTSVPGYKKKTRKCFTWNILFINKMSYGTVALHANGTGEGTGNETGTMGR